MQAHARVCEENKLGELQLENNDAYWNDFMVKDAILKDHRGRVGRCIKMIFSKIIYHNIKVLVL